ncbi:DDE_3 domain-containing protein [Trichonephila clavipes]|nr:DDE_3 domain-containing protein [Trichonephila clavipes]
MLEWCMKANLIASCYECSRCKKNMRLQKGTVDGYEGCRRNQSKDNRHDVFRSWLWSQARVAGVLWAQVLLPLKRRCIDEAIPPADVVVRKEGCQLRCPPCHLTDVQNYEAGRCGVLLARWIVQSVPLEIVGSSGHEKVPTRRKPGLEQPGRPRGGRIEGLCGKHLWNGTLMGQRYVDDILRPHVGPFLNGLPEAIFQQDNARPRTAGVAQDFLRHFQTSMAGPLPRFVPCRAHVGSSKTADAIVSLCT